MLKIQVSVFVVFLAAVTIITLSAADVDVSKFTERPGYCHIGDVYIKEGLEGPGPIGECKRIRCINATVGHEAFSAVGCSSFVPKPGCELSDYDKTKRYPDCCPRSVCDEDIEE